MIAACLLTLPFGAMAKDGMVNDTIDSVKRGAKSIWESSDISLEGAVQITNKDEAWEDVDDNVQIRRVHVKYKGQISERWQVRAAVRMNDGTIADAFDNFDEHNVKTLTFDIDMSGESAGPDAGFQILGLSVGKHRVAFNAGSSISPMKDNDPAYQAMNALSNAKVGATLKTAFSNITASISAFDSTNNDVTDLGETDFDTFAATVSGSLSDLGWEVSLLDGDNGEAYSGTLKYNLKGVDLSYSHTNVNDGETQINSVGAKWDRLYGELRMTDEEGQEEKESVILGYIFKERGQNDHCSLAGELESSDDDNAARVQMDCVIE